MSTVRHHLPVIAALALAAAVFLGHTGISAVAHTQMPTEHSLHDVTRMATHEPIVGAVAASHPGADGAGLCANGGALLCMAPTTAEPTLAATSTLVTSLVSSTLTTRRWTSMKDHSSRAPPWNKPTLSRLSVLRI